MVARRQAVKGAGRHPAGDPRTSARRSRQGVQMGGRAGGQVHLAADTAAGSSAAAGLRILQQQ